MMTSSRRSFAALGALALLSLGACKDSSGPGRNTGGEAAFTYAGDVSGRFEASGRVTLANFDDGTFAFGQLADNGGGGPSLVVYAQKGRGQGGLYDNLLILLEEPAVGTVTCTAETTDCGVLGIFALGATNDEDGDAEATFFADEGSVTITSLTDDMARGTFRFSMTGFAGENTEAEVEVTSGTFAIPLIRESDVPFSRAPR